MSAALLLPRLPEEARRRLLTLGVRAEVVDGAYLTRRGEPGGDLRLVAEGTFQVVDGRQRPELVLDTLGPGDLVDPDGFLEGTASADVRAVGPSACLTFARADLDGLTDRDPSVAAQLYRALSALLVERHRERPVDNPAPWIGRQSAEITSRARGAFTEALADPSAPDALSRAVRDLAAASSAWLLRFPEGHPGRWIAHELWAWLARSRIGRAALGRAQDRSGLAAVRAALLTDAPPGDDRFGDQLNLALADLPTVRAVRAVRAEVLRAAADTPGRRVALLSANPGAWVDAWPGPPIDAVAFGGGDPRRRFGTRSTLAAIDADLLHLASGRAEAPLRTFDQVVVDGLLEHLSDPWAISVLRFGRRLLATEGTLIVAALPPTWDEPFFRAVLDVPTVRRARDDLAVVVDAARRTAGGEARWRDGDVPVALLPSV